MSSIYKWYINNSILYLISSDNSILLPAARDIYNAVYRNMLIFNDIEIETNPRIEYPDLIFSKIPIDLKLIIDFDLDVDSINIRTYIQAYNQNTKIELFHENDDIADHIIIDGIWYPFVPGRLEEIKKILSSIDISTVGQISLQQYLKLRAIATKNPIISDLTEGVNITYPHPSDFHTLIPLFTGNLFPYQYNGFRWLKMISNADAGCILADEMGLGKTIQLIALLAWQFDASGMPSLVVAPATLLENWRRELHKFAPKLTVLIHQGPERSGLPSDLRNYNIVVTSYDTAVRDLSLLKMVNWNILITDEAQSIKNPIAKRTISVKEIPRRLPIAVTGTPFENHLTDIWSIMDFAFPGLLGTLNEFKQKYTDDLQSAELVERLISPIMLRRRVKDVAQDLPDRIDIPQPILLDNLSAIEYERIRQEILDEYGAGGVFASLTKLRMYCTHPLLLEDDQRELISSPKYERLTEILEEIFTNGEKVLIFTSYQKMADLMVLDISKRFGVQCDWIDGRVPRSDRQHKIDIFFENNGPAVLILNPRAAGTGLNITAANHVIHYNLEWNPALEDQASARAYRRGQTRPVTVHRLFYINTVEEVINMRIEQKRALAEIAVSGTDGETDNYRGILVALQLSPIQGGKSNDSA